MLQTTLLLKENTDPERRDIMFEGDYEIIELLKSKVNEEGGKQKQRKEFNYGKFFPEQYIIPQNLVGVLVDFAHREAEKAGKKIYTACHHQWW